MHIAKTGFCPFVQVPIYTLHMMTFAEPECFIPERWASKTESVPLAAPDAKVMAPALLVASLHVA